MGPTGGKRYHHFRDTQPVLERGPARLDAQLQRSRQDPVQEKLPRCTRKGTMHVMLTTSGGGGIHGVLFSIFLFSAGVFVKGFAVPGQNSTWRYASLACYCYVDAVVVRVVVVVYVVVDINVTSLWCFSCRSPQHEVNIQSPSSRGSGSMPTVRPRDFSIFWGQKSVRGR